MSQKRRRGKRLSWLFLLSTVLAFFGTSLFWRVALFWRRLWRQPRLTAIVRSTNNATNLIDDATQIAAANVRQAIEERLLPDGTRKLVLNAGWRNFREPWARDFAFASCGLLELGEMQVLKETLELFLRFQRENGQFPVKIHSTNVLERFLYSMMGRQQPIHAPLRAKHKTAHNTISLDGNALLIISALNYLGQVEDETFAHRHWHALKQGLSWLEAQALEADGLLHQGAFTDWADSIGRIGCIHYTNVLYWRALHEFARDAAKYGYDEDHTYFAQKEHQLRTAINQHFWREALGFYSTSEQFSDLLSSAGNLLAIAWGLATPEQANAILDVMVAHGMADPVPTKVTDREYGKGFVAVENRLAGIPHYHTSAAWLWLGAWHVIALVRMKRLDEAREMLTRMSALIVRDGVVHEVYGETGNHLSTLWYTSEAPLTWSASMFVYAAAVYRGEQD